MLNSFLHFVGQEGRTPLLAACLHGHIDIVRLLLAEGADKDQAMNVSNSKNATNSFLILRSRMICIL